MGKFEEKLGSTIQSIWWLDRCVREGRMQAYVQVSSMESSAHHWGPLGMGMSVMSLYDKQDLWDYSSEARSEAEK